MGKWLCSDLSQFLLQGVAGHLFLLQLFPHLLEGALSAGHGGLETEATDVGENGKGRKERWRV